MIGIEAGYDFNEKSWRQNGICPSSVGKLLPYKALTHVDCKENTQQYMHYTSILFTTHRIRQRVRMPQMVSF